MGKEQLSRKEREKLRRKEDILWAAQKCFGDKGYHECTMEDIAKENECSVGSLYNFFSGKDHIYKEIFAWHGERMKEFAASFVIDTEDPVGCIGDYILKRLEYGMEHQGFLKMFIRNHNNDNFADESLWKESIWPAKVEMEKVLSEFFRLAVEKKIVRADLDIEMVISMIEHNIFRILDEYFHNFCPDKTREMSLEESRDFMMDVLFNGISCRDKNDK